MNLRRMLSRETNVNQHFNHFNPTHPRRERRELGISPRQQKRTARKERKHNLLFNREVY